MAVQIGSPFKAGFPYNGDTGYVAVAAEIRDMDWDGTSGAGAKQSEINQEFKGEFANLKLSETELDAIINEVDMNGTHIVFGSPGITAYRHSAGDLTGASIPSDVNAYSGASIVLCFSKPDGTKYYVPFTGQWTEDSSNITAGAIAYDSANVAAGYIYYGSNGFVVSGGNNVN